MMPRVAGNSTNLKYADHLKKMYPYIFKLIRETIKTFQLDNIYLISRRHAPLQLLERITSRPYNRNRWSARRCSFRIKEENALRITLNSWMMMEMDSYLLIRSI